MRHAGPSRRDLGIPTAFNILGPLSNPGRVKRYLIGVADLRMADRMAGVLRDKGAADRDRFKCAKWLTERAYGKPPEADAAIDPVRELTEAELVERLKTVDPLVAAIKGSLQ